MSSKRYIPGDDDAGVKRAFGGSSTTGLFVSLYLILLAFFIVLEVQSETVIARSEDALDSVQATFKPSRVLGRAEPSVEDAGDTAEIDNVFLADIAQLFRDELAIEGRFSDVRGGLLAFRMEERDLFLDGAMTLRPERLDLLDRVGRLAAQAPPGIRREVSIFFSRDNGAAEGADRLLANRLSVIAERLMDAGMTPSQFVAGLNPARRGTVTVVFRRLEGPVAASSLNPWGVGE